MTINTNEAAAVVTQHIRKSIPDALERANYLWYILTTKRKEYVSGGSYLQYPVKTLKNTASGFVNGTTNVIDTNLYQQLVFGTQNWKYHVTSVSISLDDIVKTQNTDLAIASLYEKKVELGKQDAIRDLSQAIHVGSSSNPLQFDGMVDAFAASGTTYLGLLDTDYPDPYNSSQSAWLPTVIDTTTNNPTFSVLALAIAKINQRTQKMGQAGKVDLLLSNAETQALFEINEQAKQRFYPTDKKALEAGFTVMSVKGAAWEVDGFSPGSADGATADNYLYMLNTNSLVMSYKYGLDKECPMDGSIKLPNQTIDSNQIFLAGNIAMTDRTSNGVFKAIIA